MRERHLVACPACTRHARVEELACPFCGAEFDERLRATPRRHAPTRRLSRAALFAFGAGALATPAACSSSSSSSACALPSVAPPSGIVYPAGISLGGLCQGHIYFPDSSGYVFCDDGAWDYTTTEPGDCYSVDPQFAVFYGSFAAVDAGIDEGGSSGTTGSDGTSTLTTSTASDAGRGPHST